MQIQVNAGHIEGREELLARVESHLRTSLNWFSGRITRVDVHVRDENGDKGGGDDKRCVMEAHLRGRQPVAVTHHAATLDDAVHGAAAKLKTFIESVVGRLRSH